MFTRENIFTTLRLYCGQRTVAITPDMVLKNHGFDSLDMADLALHLEGCYDIRIPNSEVAMWTTVESVISTVAALLSLRVGNVDDGITDVNFLKWLYARLVLKHGEKHSYDYMRRFTKIIEKMEKGS